MTEREQNCIPSSECNVTQVANKPLKGATYRIPNFICPVLGGTLYVKLYSEKSD